MSEGADESQLDAGKFIATSVMIHGGEGWSINQRDIQLKTMGN